MTPDGSDPANYSPEPVEGTGEVVSDKEAKKDLAKEGR